MAPSAVSPFVADDMPHADAILTGAKARLRPVLTTGSMSVFSLLPMVFATGPLSDAQRPLAAVVVGGLIASTAPTLLVMPALYEWFDRGGRRVRESVVDMR